MMTLTTTLITFRVRAPPSTRTLQLFGSWDNFAMPYAMSRDLQTGSTYWSGCHSFENIICDGKPGEVIKSRSGGLKMGGTYWYFYKLDDEHDFHNVTERATTYCPLLPGQLVNVLQVPFVLSGNRSRNPSASSSSSERRTMNPNDKFMHPRPAPAKPEISRIKTSPTLLDFEIGGDDSATNGSPWSTNTPVAVKFSHLSKKPSLDSYTSSSGSTLGGLRAAFRLRGGRSNSPDSRLDQLRIPERRRAVSRGRSPLRGTDELQSSRPPTRGLLLRSASEESIATLSFQKSRGQRSGSRSGPELKLLPQLGSVDTLSMDAPSSQHATLSVVEEIVSPQAARETAATHSSAARPDVDLGKRLPTLPNTPSSAYPASPGFQSPRLQTFNLDQLDSHFSATTVDTNINTMSVVSRPDQSRFSAWTTTTGTSSVLIDDLPPPVPAIEQRHLPAPIAESPLSEIFMPSTFSMSSIASSVTSSPTFQTLEVEFNLDGGRFGLKNDPNTTYESKVQHYSLSEAEQVSQITLSQPSIEPLRSRRGSHSFTADSYDRCRTEYHGELIHSDGMQKLLDELSYLSDMIQS